ncbi:carboxypeptidase-like regulatory domain-containing protein [Flavobacterium sp. N2820]|uniref:carboxypeptidase-like regulatory domain-containing protein n=1 Tax=Flavobacterium sp. N2820 TaxID=2986834 RepID=UPI0022251F90|nr:carboxypeptidase-like regulatory domain-containing protein [Flavobacterium sp. N2820]
MNKFLVLFFISFSLSAQIKGVVKDSLSSEPIPYVNIWVENETVGTTSEIDGTFSLAIKEEKVLVFSALGYESKKGASTNEVIFLKPIAYELNEVVVEQPRFKEEIEIGDVNKPNYLPEPQTTPWIHARKFEFNQIRGNSKFIKSLKFFTNSEVDNGVFRVRIFEVNTEGMPGKDLVDEDILVTVKKGKKKTIVDVSKFTIQIPENGIIVGFESLIIEQNKFEQEVHSQKPKKGFKVTNYSPHIMYFYNDFVEHYTYRSGKWLYFNKAYKEKFKETYRIPIPAINLILTN